MVKLIKTEEDLAAQLAEAGDKLVIVDFYATWCGPCKQIAPQLEQLERERSDIIVLKVDVDESDALTNTHEITAMPTFVLFKNSEKKESFAGANFPKLLELINKYQPA